jgi:hypothetical protein
MKNQPSPNCKAIWKIAHLGKDARRIARNRGFLSGGHFCSSAVSLPNVRFCLVTEIFAGSFHLYVNVLKESGRDFGGEWRVLFWKKVGVFWSFLSKK